MLEATGWGLVGGAALIVGALAGLWLKVSQRFIGLVTAFGAGVLVSALAFELTEEAFHRGGFDAVAVGLAAGALVFSAGNWLIVRSGGAHRKRSGGEQADGSAKAIALGTVLDGIPESFAIGLSLLEGKGIGISLVLAVFISNVPEALASARGLWEAGHSTRYILGLWAGVTVMCGGAAALGFGLLARASPNVFGFTEAFAAGAILTMLADTMMPEAFQHGGNLVGLLTVLGFASAFFVSQLD